MIIEGIDKKFEVFLEMIQFEITGRCNMQCKHCRAWKEPKNDMTLEIVDKVLSFAIPEAGKEIRFTISGGEPLLHPDFFKILDLIKNKVSKAKNTKIDHTVITTNGSLVNKEVIQKLEKVGLGELFLQVSLDSSEKKVHDDFRGFPGAFEKAISAIKLVVNSKLTSMIRTTIIPAQISNMERMIKLADKYGVKRVSFGPVIPSGKAQIDKSLILNKNQKKKFIENILLLKKKYPYISISTEDPVKFSMCSKEWDYGDSDYSREDFIGGCSAGITNINVLADGTITPCSMMLKPITNVKNKNPQEILKDYTSSKIIRNLVERNVKGKCKTCEFGRLCGGCRATAYGISGDYLAEDPTCWK